MTKKKVSNKGILHCWDCGRAMEKDYCGSIVCENKSPKLFNASIAAFEDKCGMCKIIKGRLYIYENFYTREEYKANGDLVTRSNIICSECFVVMDVAKGV